RMKHLLLTPNVTTHLHRPLAGSFRSERRNAARVRCGKWFGVCSNLDRHAAKSYFLWIQISFAVKNLFDPSGKADPQVSRSLGAQGPQPANGEDSMIGHEPQQGA